MKPTLEDIQDATLKALEIRKEVFAEARNSRKSVMVKARQIICSFGQRYGYSQPKIGKFLNINHSTVHYSKVIARDYYKYEKEYAKTVDEVERLLKEIEDTYEASIEHSIVGWVARDAFDGNLNFFKKKPRYLDGCWIANGEFYRLPVDYFPQIEYDSKPQSCEMIFKLK